MTIYRIQLDRRFSDLDQLGHVNNVVYGDYVQEARIRVNRRMRAEGVEMPAQVVARQEIDYIRPLHLNPEPIVVEVWVESVGNSSYVQCQRIYDNDGTLAAKSRTVVVAFDPVAEKSRPLPAGFREYLLGAIEVVE